MTVGPDVTIVIFGTLVQGVAYDVTVSGSTEEGEGTTSVPFTISTIPTEGTCIYLTSKHNIYNVCVCVCVT